jgi:peroxiredoxin
MEKFPVTSSILSSEHVGLFVAKQYGLAANVSCTLLKAGINHSYLVTQSESKFVFRLYSLNWRSDLEINEEIRLLNILSDEGISVSYPIKDSDNKYIQYLQAPEGVRQGLLFSFAEGDKQISLPADLHNKIGQTMARIHQATINLQLEIVVLNFWFTKCTPCIDEIAELNKLTSMYKNSKVRFLAITFDKAQAVQNFQKEHGFKFELLPDAKMVTDDYGIKRFPQTMVIDKAGIIRLAINNDEHIFSKVKDTIDAL